MHFFKGGLIEAWGSGTLKISDECKKAGLPEPDIEINSGGISVTIFKNIYSEKQLNDKGLSDWQIQNEKIVEWFSEYDALGMMRQLGMELQMKQATE